jgi:hypothetical protein
VVALEQMVRDKTLLRWNQKGGVSAQAQVGYAKSNFSHCLSYSGVLLVDCLLFLWEVG